MTHSNEKTNQIAADIFTNYFDVLSHSEEQNYVCFLLGYRSIPSVLLFVACHIEIKSRFMKDAAIFDLMCESCISDWLV